MWRERLRALGTELTPEMIQGTMALAAGAHEPQLTRGIDVERDVSYGDHERNVLDLYTDSEHPDLARPVLLYVHGGGFVTGSKGDGDSPFGPNIGSWAAGRGYVAAAMNYRLVPDAGWPDGAYDIGAAVGWLRENVSRFGGDAERIVVVGQSAGAMHVADYLALRADERVPPIAGAALISCLYDVGNAADLPMHRAYWGEDRSAWAAKGSIGTILDCDIPLLLAVAEWDEPQFHTQAATLVAAWVARHGTYPPLHVIPNQNHLSTVYAIGSPHDRLGPTLGAFIDDRIR